MRSYIPSQDLIYMSYNPYIGTKEEFTSEVKSEFEPVSSDKSDNVQIVDKKLQELNPEMIEARKCR